MLDLSNKKILIDYNYNNYCIKAITKAQCSPHLMLVWLLRKSSKDDTEADNFKWSI